MAACGYGNSYQADAGGYNAAPVAEADCEDCGELVQTTKKVQVPCTKNKYTQYTVKVPRQVVEKVPRTVHYTDFETRDKTIKYTEMTCQTRMREEQQQYTVPVQKVRTRMKTVTKKVPKTIYVDVVTEEPEEYTETVDEVRTKMVKIPYQVQVPQERTKVVQERVPVNKQKTVFEDVTKTVYDTQVKTRCEPTTTMVTKSIPVYHWKPKNPEPCTDCGDCAQTVPAPEPQPEPQPEPERERVAVQYEAPAQYDADGDGFLDPEERAEAAKHGDLKVTRTPVPANQEEEEEAQGYEPRETAAEKAAGAAGDAVGNAVGGAARAASTTARKAKRRTTNRRKSSRSRKSSGKRSSNYGKKRSSSKKRRRRKRSSSR